MCQISGPGESHESLVCFQIKHLNPPTYVESCLETYAVQILFFLPFTNHYQKNSSSYQTQVTVQAGILRFRPSGGEELLENPALR